MAMTAAERGRQVRERLLTAARELIVERGWRGVTTRTLAERARVAPGLVHYHFGSLQELLGEAAISALRELVRSIGPNFQQASSMSAGLDLMLMALDRYTGDDPMSLLFCETYLASTRDATLRTAVESLLSEFRVVLADWLRDRGCAQPEQTAAVLAAAIDGIMLHRAVDPSLTSGVVAPVLQRVLTGDRDRPRSAMRRSSNRSKRRERS